ncbi:MAG: class I SAM-dependent methyltransferase, partial [Gammaproteobacteria bacterium]
ALSGLAARSGIEVLDIGSASFDFRTRVQAHIGENVHTPLVDRGYRITYLDREPDVGVDVVADLCAPMLNDALVAVPYDLILCCNILEHVENRAAFISNVMRLLKPGGLLLVTVPRRYPCHHDPIDTMYRPSVSKLVGDIARAGAVTVIRSGVVRISERSSYIRKKIRRLDYLLPFRTNSLWRYYLPIFRWQVACVLLERSGSVR